jgi:hypothetical protein
MAQEHQAEGAERQRQSLAERQPRERWRIFVDLMGWGIEAPAATGGNSQQQNPTTASQQAGLSNSQF